MPTPAMPTGFKPIIQGYGIGPPDGVEMTEVAGGMPRVGLRFDRGKQAYQVTLILLPDAFFVWQTFFHKKIDNGAIQFTMPLDSGEGLEPHLCIMVPGTLNVARAGDSPIWSVTFTVLAESPFYALTDDAADSILDFWEGGYTEGLEELLDRLAIFALSDTLVLEPAP